VNEMGDPADNGERLARARSCNDQDRTECGSDGLFLGVIETVEYFGMMIEHKTVYRVY